MYHFMKVFCFKVNPYKFFDAGTSHIKKTLLTMWPSILRLFETCLAAAGDVLGGVFACRFTLKLFH